MHPAFTAAPFPARYWRIHPKRPSEHLVLEQDGRETECTNVGNRSVSLESDGGGGEGPGAGLEEPNLLPRRHPPALPPTGLPHASSAQATLSLLSGHLLAPPVRTACRPPSQEQNRESRWGVGGGGLDVAAQSQGSARPVHITRIPAFPHLGSCLAEGGDT